MTAALPMGGQKITGMADPALATDAATKNYVDTTTAAFFSTGDVKLTLKTAADTGWILFDDGTFGSAASGASSRANADTQLLFTLFFNNISDANAPLLTSGGAATTRAAQTNAATAWAANCRMSLTKTLGRALGVAGVGSGLTSRVLGQSLGAESVTLGASNIPTITASGTISVTSAQTNIVQASIVTNVLQGGGVSFQMLSGAGSGLVTSNGTNSLTYTNGSPGAVSIMQPTVFLNAMVKL